MFPNSPPFSRSLHPLALMFFLHPLPQCSLGLKEDDTHVPFRAEHPKPLILEPWLFLAGATLNNVITALTSYWTPSLHQELTGIPSHTGGWSECLYLFLAIIHLFPVSVKLPVRRKSLFFNMVLFWLVLTGEKGVSLLKSVSIIYLVLVPNFTKLYFFSMSVRQISQHFYNFKL